MKRSPLRPTLLMFVAASCAFGAVGAALPSRVRSPDSVAAPVRPIYSWDVSLARGTRAAVGPIDAKKSLKIRLDTAGSLVPLEEPLIICLDHYCETLDPRQATDTDTLAGDDVQPADQATDQSGHQAQSGLQLDLSEALQRLSRDGVDAGAKTYLTLQRKSPGATELLTVSVKVETERTSELPEFSEAP